jgi:asparagine synthase (glutamine-hydrolysing)
VLERRSKAVFTHAVFTGHTREFARGWTGDGVDPALVDPEVLRDNWLSASPHAPSMTLLQQAWLSRAQRSNAAVGEGEHCNGHSTLP